MREPILSGALILGLSLTASSIHSQQPPTIDQPSPERGPGTSSREEIALGNARWDLFARRVSEITGLPIPAIAVSPSPMPRSVTVVSPVP